MPFPTEHSARIKSPDIFVKGSFRSKTLKSGIRIIAGKLKTDPSGSMKTQTYRFNKANYTVDQAKKWLSDNNVKYISFEAAKQTQNFKEKKIFIQCSTLELTADEIIKNIPDNVYNEIKQKDQHPYFQAYSIIHNGISKPRDVNENTYKPIEWGKEVIQKLKGKIKRGLQFFIGHNKDNSTDGRRSLGEVIADFQKNIDDKLHHIVIGYFQDKVEAQKYDVNSIEANIITEEYPNMSIAKKIENITGIALGNSQKDKPAFAGAIRLGTVQAFGDDGAGDPPPPDKNKRKEIPMTFEEVKSAVKSMNIFANQLFTEDDLKNDKVFGKLFDQVSIATEKEKDLLKKLEDKETEIKSLQRNISESDAHNKLENILKTFETDDKKLTDLQKSFINKRFDPKGLEEISDEKIKEFVDNSLKEYPEYASIFGDNNGNGNGSDNSDNNDNDTENVNKDDIDQVVEEILK